MAKFTGPGQKMNRAPRTKNTPRDGDAQTELEAEMASSGRSDITPKQGLVGAHTSRLEPSLAAEGIDGADEPPASGSEVAPTKLAEERERERHFLERQRGRKAAGVNNIVREERARDVTREDLDASQREADRRVIGHEIPEIPRTGG